MENKKESITWENITKGDRIGFNASSVLVVVERLGDLLFYKQEDSEVVKMKEINVFNCSYYRILQENDKKQIYTKEDIAKILGKNVNEFEIK